MPPKTDSICDVPGLLVGCKQHAAAKTGCTVFIPENYAVAGVDIRGSAPGTREIEAIKPVRLVPKIHGLLLTGGSAFGLDAAGGVQEFLEEQDRGMRVGEVTVPIVPAAVIFDLQTGDPQIRPDKKMGYLAAKEATAKSPPEGLFGAGCGATVGKLLGFETCMPGGQGSASFEFDGVWVGTFAVVNSFGNIFNPEKGVFIAGAKNLTTGEFADINATVSQLTDPILRTNTTLGVVATNAKFSKEEITKVAQMAQDGFARTIYPAHSPFDGDAIFSLSLGEKTASVLAVGTIAADLMATSVLKAVKASNNLS